MRKQFSESCFQLLSENENAVVLLGDIGVHGFRNTFTEFPRRIFNLGIMEQTMVGTAAGMASVGCIPVVHTIAPFLVERALEQIKVDFGYQQLVGNFVSVGASFDYAGLGCTHHCPADIGIMRSIPGLNVFIPGTSQEFAYQFAQYWDGQSSNYFRLSERENSSSFLIKLGESVKIKDGNTALAVVAGNLLDEVLEATKSLDIEIHYVNSIQTGKKLHLESAVRDKPIFLIEPYYSGALFQYLEDYIQLNSLIPVQFGVPVEFIRDYGNYDSMLQNVLLDKNALHEKFLKYL